MWTRIRRRPCAASPRQHRRQAGDVIIVVRRRRAGQVHARGRRPTSVRANFGASGSPLRAFPFLLLGFRRRAARASSGWTRGPVRPPRTPPPTNPAVCSFPEAPEAFQRFWWLPVGVDDAPGERARRPRRRPIPFTARYSPASPRNCRANPSTSSGRLTSTHTPLVSMSSLCTTVDVRVFHTGPRRRANRARRESRRTCPMAERRVTLEPGTGGRQARGFVHHQHVVVLVDHVEGRGSATRALPHARRRRRTRSATPPARRPPPRASARPGSSAVWRPRAAPRAFTAFTAAATSRHCPSRRRTPRPGRLAQVFATDRVSLDELATRGQVTVGSPCATPSLLLAVVVIVVVVVSFCRGAHRRRWPPWRRSRASPRTCARA